MSELTNAVPGKSVPKEEETPQSANEIEIRVCTSAPIFVENPERPWGPGLRKDQGDILTLPKAQASPLLKRGIVELVLEEDMTKGSSAPRKKRKATG